MALAHWQNLAETLAGHLLNSMLEGVVIALFGSLLLRMLAKQNSSVRFAVLLSALAAIAALPIVDSFRSTAAVLGGTQHSALNLPASWAADIVILWAVIAAVGLAKIALGFHQLQKLRQTCIPVNSESFDAALLITLQKFGAGRNVTLCTSAEVRVPTAIGFKNPAIVIPSWAISELTPIELNAIVLHELAHLRRRDDWTNLAQKIMRAVLFFHPAVWWLGRGLTREREMACDDFVLSATSDRRAYAECLVSVAEKTFLRRGLALAQAFVGRVQLTAQRVAHILASDRPIASASAVCKPALAMVAAASAICLISFPHLPMLVGFDAAKSSPQAGLNRSMASWKYLPLNLDSTRSLGAHAIPATFQPAPNNEQSSGKQNSRVLVERKRLIKSGNSTNSISASVVTAQIVGSVPSGDHSGRTVEAAFKKNSEQPSAVLVVMQSSRVDESGQIWSIYVWRLTVFHPDEHSVSPIINPEVRKAAPPKST